MTTEQLNYILGNRNYNFNEWIDLNTDDNPLEFILTESTEYIFIQPGRKQFYFNSVDENLYIRYLDGVGFTSPDIFDNPVAVTIDGETLYYNITTYEAVETDIGYISACMGFQYITSIHTSRDGNVWDV